MVTWFAMNQSFLLQLRLGGPGWYTPSEWFGQLSRISDRLEMIEDRDNTWLRQGF